MESTLYLFLSHVHARAQTDDDVSDRSEMLSALRCDFINKTNED